MPPRKRGIARLNSLILASLLLHLVAILALGRGQRREAQPRPQASMVLEYLESGVNMGRAAAPEAPRQVSVPGRHVADRTGASVKPLPAAVQAALSRFALPQHGPGSAPPSASAPEATGRGKESGSAAAPPAAPAGAVTQVKATGIGSLQKSEGSGAPKIGARVQSATGVSAVSRGGGAGAGALSTAALGRSGGTSGGARKGAGAWSSSRSAYQAKLKSLVEAHKEYPLAARRSGREGSCRRRFSLGRDGSLKRVEELTTCGHPFLDSAATRAITAVGKFPPLPEEYPGTEESFTITMTFSLAVR